MNMVAAQRASSTRACADASARARRLDSEVEATDA